MYRNISVIITIIQSCHDEYENIEEQQPDVT